MKPRFLSLCAPAALTVVCLGLIHGVHAADAPAAVKAGSTNSLPTNSANAELAIPLSVFDLTAKPTRDPFFPNSTRSPFPQATNAAPVFSPSCLTLKGVSGSSSQRLAIINNRTVAAGEDAEVATTAGKVKIHCIEVKETSVVLRLAGQSDLMEISLRKILQ